LRFLEGADECVERPLGLSAKQEAWQYCLATLTSQLR